LKTYNIPKKYIFFILVFSGLVFGSGLILGMLIEPILIHSNTSISKPDLDVLFRPFFQAWDIVHEQYLNQPVDDRKMMWGAIRGMMESLEDPFSAYMDPDEYREQNTPLLGEYTGIGAWVDTSGEFLIIMSPMPNSPAEKAGLLPGDSVIGIDGEDMTSMDPTLVLKRILGPEGSEVEITIQRGITGEQLVFNIVREVIPIPSIESEMLEEGIGYVRLYTFGQNSTEEFINAMIEMKQSNPRVLILDLRNNTGGYVDTAIEIASIFISDGTLMIEEMADGKRKEYQAVKSEITTDLPLVVLVNEGSASASEIVAGALQDYDRATLIGTRTFGKGLIQNWVPLEENNGAIRISIARWLTPKGRQIQDYGLEPNIQIELTDDDILNQVDAQLNKAIEYINGMVLN